MNLFKSAAFKVVASSPEVSAEQPASKKLSEQKEKMTYATVNFLEPETQAEQQHFNLPENKLSLIKGATSPAKIFLLRP